MNIAFHLFVSSLLMQIWIMAVLAAYLMQQKEIVPRRYENHRWVRLLSPLFYVILVAVVAYFLAVPISIRSALALLIALVPITLICIVTLAPRTRDVRNTAGGRRCV